MHAGDRADVREDFAFVLFVCREVSAQLFLEYLIFVAIVIGDHGNLIVGYPVGGRVIVLIRPGEELAGLNRIGVKAEMVPFSSV